MHCPTFSLLSRQRSPRREYDMTFEVETPILNSPFEEPQKHWYMRPGETPECKDGRRRAMVFQPRDA